MKTPTKIISISGLDGSGKTTIINELRATLSENGFPTRYVWLRYNHYLTKLLLGYCRLMGHTEYEVRMGVRAGYHNFTGHAIISWAFVLLSLFDTLIASMLKVYLPSIFGKSIIICDRWISDIMIDLEVDTGLEFRPGGILYRIWSALIPSGTRQFLIRRDIASLMQARTENVLDRNFLQRAALFELHAESGRLIPIDNAGTVRMAVDQILSRTGFDEQARCPCSKDGD